MRVDINMSDGRRTVDATVHGAWAAHASPSGAWAVSHVGTGMALAACVDEVSARLVALGLSRVANPASDDPGMVVFEMRRALSAAEEP